MAYQSHILRVNLFVLALGVVGCSGEDAFPTESLGQGQGDAAAQASDWEQIARFAGRLRDGGLELREVPNNELAVSSQNFGEFTSGLVSFNTLAGDGVGTGTCTANQYCGTVTAQNGTGVLMDNMWVEITDLTATPAGAQVTWAGPAVSLSDTYKSLFVNTTSPQAANYGNFTVNQTKSLEWKFNINAGSVNATNFDFTALVYASFRYTAMSGTFLKKRAAVNACSISGSVNYLQGSDDSETDIALPFPFTLYDITYDRAVIGSNGYFLPYRTGGAVPTAAGPNQSTGTAGLAVGLYVFWDDLAFDAGNGLCAATSGAKPNRTFTLTWNNAKINAAQPAKGTWTTERVTYSLLINESSDVVTFAYNLPTGGAGITNLTRGISATTGTRVIRNGSAIGANNSFNALSAYIPANSADYGSRIVKTGTPSNP